MIGKEKKFDVNDCLTIDLLLGHFLKGKIPKSVRREGETQGATNRRRTMLCNLMKKYPVEAKQCLKEFHEHLELTPEFKEQEKKLLSGGLSISKLLSYKNMIAFVKNSRSVHAHGK